MASASDDDTTRGARHDDAALDPAAMLDLLETQQRSVASQFSSFAWIITGIWGIAWLIGFGALWLMTAFAPAFALAAPVAYGILIASLSVAVLVSIVFGIRSGHGVRESRASAFTGAVYGCAWSISMVGIWVLGSSMASRGMPDDIASYYFTSAFVLMTGVMMVISAAIWQMKPALVVGIWLVAIAAIAPLFGIPGNYLFLALAGGLVFILFAVGSLVHGIRLKRRASGAQRG